MVKKLWMTIGIAIMFGAYIVAWYSDNTKSLVVFPIEEIYGDYAVEHGYRWSEAAFLLYIFGLIIWGRNLNTRYLLYPFILFSWPLFMFASSFKGIDIKGIPNLLALVISVYYAIAKINNNK